MHPRFQTAFAQLADNLQSALEPILADKYFPALLTGEQVSSLKSATGLDEDALAFALLPLAAACARTPLSNFNVGAIARGVSGTWYFGANMEFIGATMLTGDALSQAAIAAANHSHMPYSKSPSGVALECKDGRIFSGSYAENAAFNPTLPPLQGALILLNLKGYDYPDIQRAVLAEKADAPLIQWDATSATLKALGCHSIDRVLLA